METKIFLHSSGNPALFHSAAPFHFIIFFFTKRRLCSSAARVNNQIKPCCAQFLTHLPASPTHPSPLCLSNRAVASVLQGGCPGEQYRGEEALGMHSQHFVSRATNLREFKFLLFLFLLSFCFVLTFWELSVCNFVPHTEARVCRRKKQKRSKCAQVIWSDDVSVRVCVSVSLGIRLSWTG